MTARLEALTVFKVEIEAERIAAANRIAGEKFFVNRLKNEAYRLGSVSSENTSILEGLGKTFAAAHEIAAASNYNSLQVFNWSLLPPEAQLSKVPNLKGDYGYTGDIRKEEWRLAAEYAGYVTQKKIKEDNRHFTGAPVKVRKP